MRRCGSSIAIWTSAAPRMTQNLTLRHRIVRFIREYLSDRDFLEIETPILLKSTPEGARDFVVPSRLHPGEFYALPQSPQQLKQLLMVAGIERYFQIARCFRDEDLRADRQPEFTQLDLEMSFVDAGDIRALIEGLLIELTATRERATSASMQLPFPVIRYADAMENYGIDRPGPALRAAALQRHAGDGRQRSLPSSRTQRPAAARSRASSIPAARSLTRREIDELTEFVKHYGAKGLVWIGVAGEPDADGPLRRRCAAQPGDQVPVARRVAHASSRTSGAKVGDLILIVADKPGVVAQSLSNLRLEIGKRANLIDPNLLAYCWVIDFPLLEYNDEEKRWQAVHHPFTSARDEDWDKLESDPGSVLAKAYDVVLNGWEIGGGSIRIHRSDRQDRLFATLGPEQGRDAGAVRPPAGGVPVRRAAARRHCAGHRPPGGALCRGDQHPRRDCLPQDRGRHRPDAGLTVPDQREAAGRAVDRSAPPQEGLIHARSAVEK